MKWIVKALVSLMVLAALIFAAWMWFAVSFSYSTGERAGYLQKFSKRGWLVKTWEGELAMVNLPGAMPEIFHFSVKSADAAQQMQAAVGQRVSLTYEEHRHIPLPIFGETDYFATAVRPMDAAVIPSGAPATAPAR